MYVDTNMLLKLLDLFKVVRAGVGRSIRFLVLCYYIYLDILCLINTLYWLTVTILYIDDNQDKKLIFTCCTKTQISKIYLCSHLLQSTHSMLLATISMNHCDMQSSSPVFPTVFLGASLRGCANLSPPHTHSCAKISVPHSANVHSLICNL